jgi:hypothetical protein
MRPRRSKSGSKRRSQGDLPSFKCKPVTAVALINRLAGQFRVIAVDLYESGKTVAWPQDEPMRLDDEG